MHEMANAMHLIDLQAVARRAIAGNMVSLVTGSYVLLQTVAASEVWEPALQTNGVWSRYGRTAGY